LSALRLLFSAVASLIATGEPHAAPPAAPTAKSVASSPEVIPARPKSEVRIIFAYCDASTVPSTAEDLIADLAPFITILPILSFSVVVSFVASSFKDFLPTTPALARDPAHKRGSTKSIPEF